MRKKIAKIMSKDRAGKKNGAYKVQEAEGANCLIRARRMKGKRKRMRIEGQRDEGRRVGRRK